MLPAHTISYAQNREDIILAGFFDDKEKGFYVDIGGLDPDYDSVTKLFYEKNWHGINVEPQVGKYKLFVKRRPRDINVNMGISNENTVLNLRSYNNPGLSTFSEEMKQEYSTTPSEHTATHRDVPVKVSTLERLFQLHKVQSIQFMKVDVEGMEYEVLSGNNWSKYRPEVICIEANHVKKGWKAILTKNNYSLAFFDGLNEYYTDNKTDRADKFDYVEAVVLKEPIVNFKLHDSVRDFKKIITEQNDQINALNIDLIKQRGRVEDLSRTLSEVTPLRKHLRRQFKYWLKKCLRRN